MSDNLCNNTLFYWVLVLHNNIKIYLLSIYVLCRQYKEVRIRLILQVCYGRYG